MSGRARFCILMLAAFGRSAYAEQPTVAQDYASQGHASMSLTEWPKAIEEFGQAYRQERKAPYLYWIAQCYEQLASLPTKTPAEALESKQRALSIYQKFIETALPMEIGVENARGRIESLRQEIKELTGQLAEQEVSAKILNENIKLLLTEIRALRELLLRRPSGERAAIPTALGKSP
jgi:tetratricopeptide (TPR) repeat protein